MASRLSYVKLGVAAGAAALLLLFSVGLMGASVQRTVGSESTASADTFGVSVTTERSEGSQVIWDDGSVSRAVTIENIGDDCWCRIRTIYSAQGLADEATAAGYALPEGWVLAADGYAYKTTLLAAGEKVVFDEAVSDVFSGAADGELEAAAHVEVLQNYGVEPDFEAASPWGAYVSEGAAS